VSQSDCRSGPRSRISTSEHNRRNNSSLTSESTEREGNHEYPPSSTINVVCNSRMRLPVAVWSHASPRASSDSSRMLGPFRGQVKLKESS
jgi:hypothetical protein